MKTRDFEKAIDALAMEGLVKDEVTLRRGSVTMFYAHIGSKLLKWGPFGACYSCEFWLKNPKETTLVHRHIRAASWRRTKMYDLKFGQ